MKDRGRKRNSVSVEFLGIDPDVIQELTKRRKLAGILLLRQLNTAIRQHR